MSAQETTYDDFIDQSSIERLTKLGASATVAELVADHVDLYKVEALVLARKCPIDLAIRISLYV